MRFKPELHTLKLSDGDLKTLSGKQNLTLGIEQFLQLYTVYEKSPELFRDMLAENLVIRPSMSQNAGFREQLAAQLQEKRLGKKSWLGKGLNALTKNIETKIGKYLQSFQPCPLGVLLDEAARYNAILDEMAALESRQDAASLLYVSEWQGIVERLRQVRAELMRAIGTERFFREHPEVNANELFFTLYSWETLELDEHARQYERFLNDAVEIGVSVWELMRLWYQKTPTTPELPQRL